MRFDRQALLQLRTQARQARAEGHFPHAARLEQQAVEIAGALGLIGERTRALLWQGYSLHHAGEDDLALAALLRAANERAATADPADVFGALIAVIHISLNHKPTAFSRALLDQGRRYLADLNPSWSAPLDYLEGEWAYRQGDFATAEDWHSRAWAAWRDQHPRLTAATHLWALCRVAFRRRDVKALISWTQQLSALELTQPLERQLAQRAALLCWRAQRNAACVPPDTAPVETALALLQQSALKPHRDNGARTEALRALALAGCWDRVDAALRQQPLSTADPESAHLLASLASNRTQLAQGLPIVDDEFDVVNLNYT
ncbi:MAG: hypothetical protein IPL51_18785 [Candidatus Competibacteraceae bacterium]|nr:hypothetical protein [Candidatus Competibacteraceae bacterium]